MPEILKAANAFAKITNTTICGTDLQILAEMFPLLKAGKIWEMKVSASLKK